MGLAATSELLELKILALVADPQIFSSRIVLVSFRKPRKGFFFYPRSEPCLHPTSTTNLERFGTIYREISTSVPLR